MAKIFKPGKPDKRRAKPRTPPQKIETLSIERLADDGRGIAYHGGKVVFVANALPGERINVRLLRQQKRFDEALAVEILDASPSRRPVACAHAGDCGGCQLQHLELAAQRSYKRDRLQAVIDAQRANVEVTLLAGEAVGYRHRARLSYRAGHLGFRAAASHHLVDVEACPVLESVLEPAVMAARPLLLSTLKNLKTAELHFACDDDGRVGLALTLPQEVDTDWCEALKVALQPLELHSVSSNQTRWSGGFPALRYGGELGVSFVPGDFTQANRPLNTEMIEQAITWLAPHAGEQIVDYFCGLGNFSFALAQSGAHVLGLDMGDAMLERASARADALGLSIEFARTDLFDSENIVLRGAAKVLLDPPRAGAKALCEALAASKELQSLVYVSCDPASLARDLSILSEGGFHIRQAVAVDMFPHTHHLESMVWLSRPSAG
ncbi:MULTISPECIES: methyltransferase domain-containing protein [Spongiibacter]|uniref:methyltransferase domain-containing protein n=1 Tax=Spongiibacter TaxID=630749 RepID=UPI000C45C1FF|nr:MULTISPECIES: methyltransferase domain-containing protein [Spongiibacter]MBO6753996.1 methyltransferase domain-containing protein [Spongiibacter sp.]MBU70544.1 23S rRNA (uracil(1939)-C(5))-methyltransferase [Spongiibacter sp.]|tara:strand:- start:5006 stop:6316 length:1311 start_codon:yes stop_codon:yes gene_type:complete